EALPDVDRLLDNERLPVDERILLASVTVFALSIAKRFEQCAPYAEWLRRLLPREDPVIMGKALMTLAHLAYMQGNYADAEPIYKALLEPYGKLEPGPQRTLLEVKVHSSNNLLAWEMHGSVEEPLAGQLETLEKGGLDQHAGVVIRQNAAVNMAILWQVDAAISTLRQALENAAPYHRLMLEAMLAFLELDVAKFPALLSAARRWEQLELSERVSALWLRTLRFSGDLRTGSRIGHTLQTGPYTKLELLWVAEAAGDRQEALRLLEETRGAYPYREFMLHWQAANYLLTRSEVVLDELLGLVQLSHGHGRLLRFVGLGPAHLPRHM